MPFDYPALIKQFRDVTGSDENRAIFFLESSIWNLDTALFSFFEHGAGTTNNPAMPTLSDSDPELLDDDNPPPPPVSKKQKPKKPSRTSYATLASLQQSSSSDEEEGQAFYAGGSERSGQQILGPPGKKDDIVGNMFRSVKQHGATIMNPSGEGSSSSVFSGVAYKLGTTPEDSSVVGDKRAERNKKPDPKQVVILRLWRNGFSLDGGELRTYADPANAEFLDHVKRGEIPAELRRGPEVYLTMEDRRHEEFSRQAAGPALPFQGKGHLLGSPVPTTIGSTAPDLSGPSDKEANEKAAQSALNLNEGEPITNIQFRLADGSRLVGRFNHTHTVANLREYILAASPRYQLQDFILQTTFPNRELTEMGLTIKEAGLLNALVVQRLK